MGWRDLAPDEWRTWRQSTVRMLDDIARQEGADQAVTVARVLARTIPLDIAPHRPVDTGYTSAAPFGQGAQRRQGVPRAERVHMTDRDPPRTVEEQVAAYRRARAAARYGLD